MFIYYFIGLSKYDHIHSQYVNSTHHVIVVKLHFPIQYHLINRPAGTIFMAVGDVGRDIDQQKIKPTVWHLSVTKHPPDKIIHTLYYEWTLPTEIYSTIFWHILNLWWEDDFHCTRHFSKSLLLCYTEKRLITDLMIWEFFNASGLCLMNIKKCSLNRNETTRCSKHMEIK